MKCFTHPIVDAVGQCHGCQKALCVECVSRFDKPRCEHCFVEQNRSVSREMYKSLGITLFILGAWVWYATNSDLAEKNVSFYIIPGLLLAFTYWGWRFLTEKAPVLTGGTGMVWLIYFFIKFILSYFIGIIVGPYQLFKITRKLILAKRENKKVLSG